MSTASFNLDGQLITNAEALGQIANEILRKPWVGIDTETTALNPREGEIRLLQINTGDNIYLIDLFKTGTMGPIKDALANSPKCVKILHNAKFDQKWLKHHYDLELWPLFDTYRASAVLYNGKNYKHKLETLYARELEVFSKVPAMGGSDWSGPLSDTQLEYSTEDVYYLPMLKDALEEKIKKLSLERTVKVENGVVLPESVIELNGMGFDPDAWVKIAKHNKAMKAKWWKWLVKRMPNPTDQLVLPGMEPPFNLDSTAQLLKSLHKMGCPAESVKQIELAMFAAEFPLIKAIFRYKMYSKRLASFGQKYLSNISPYTGRIHPEYFPFTGAGRYACSRPNLQQIPRGALYRGCFPAAPGWALVAADYAGVEMVIMAELSKDPELTRVFRDNLDAHRNTAALVNNIPYERVTSDMRQQAKALNFGLLYGMGWRKLILYAMANYGVTFTPKQARTFHKRFFESYHGVRLWQDLVVRDGKRNRHARTLSGRIRYLEDREYYTEFMNTPDQGTGADALKTSLRMVYFRLKNKFGDDVKMVHHVHDEIICECRDDEDLKRQVAHEISEGMKEGIGWLVKSVPVKVDPKWGKTWADVK